MLALGLVLNPLGIGLFCWLMFERLYMRCCFRRMSTFGMMAFRGGAGVVPARCSQNGFYALTLVIGRARSP
jgi:hypothetical protein